MVKKKEVLLVSASEDEQWYRIVLDALSSFCNVHLNTIEDAIESARIRYYDIIVLFSISENELMYLVSRLRKLSPETRIVVATESPTWRRAREVLLAGAADYIIKSQSPKEIRSQIQAILNVPSPK